MKTAYDRNQIIENDNGWIFYDAAFKCWKSIYKNIEGESVLDVGCGGGVSLALIKIFNPFLKVTGFEGYDSGKEIWEMRNLNVSSGDIYSLPYEDNSFDTVYSSHVLEHCERPIDVIKETIRVAKKRIIHIVPDGNIDEKNFGSFHIHKFNRKNYLELFQIPKIKIVSFNPVLDFHINSLIIVCDVTK